MYRGLTASMDNAGVSLRTVLCPVSHPPVRHPGAGAFLAGPSGIPELPRLSCSPTSSRIPSLPSESSFSPSQRRKSRPPLTREEQGRAPAAGWQGHVRAGATPRGRGGGTAGCCPSGAAGRCPGTGSPTTSGCSGRSWTVWRPAGPPASPSPRRSPLPLPGLARTAPGRPGALRSCGTLPCGTSPGTCTASARRPPSRSLPGSSTPGSPAVFPTCTPTSRSPSSCRRPPGATSPATGP